MVISELGLMHPRLGGMSTGWIQQVWVRLRQQGMGNKFPSKLRLSDVNPS